MIEHANERQARLTGENDIAVSFEFFPPQNEKMEEALWQSITKLAPISPRFVSVTYGASGSTRERTHNTVARILKETSLQPAAHLTCVDASRDEVNEVIRSYWNVGVRNIVALRGDPVGGIGTAYEPHPDGYVNAVDLVGGIRKIADFDISVAAYPERHPESADWGVELDNLKRKVDAGAARSITQFFFDNDLFESYLERVWAAGINIPILPGIVPIHSFKQIASFSEKTGTSVPDWLAHRFEGLDEDPETRKLVAATVAAEQVMDLVDRGITDFHFYTMNKADLVFAICHILGLRPTTPEQEAA
ncbi:methylenetetrahydrofolate reductase [NAD(P)H] [Breoghania sp.]|uniref:methylenetetrahydrofolate reductase [NAD(P)H] n=1 Tax=Breoghania sp. TaxID=2065378 RepID=UPI002638AB03|nr:methylenetetrahydrofolate reductase [NAD(P)H] [Breoghania sp.]MDJ0931466.1 methylenetetrahydrofolate reductase [NAD(P)H] [Breoghania sp.]